MSKRLLMIGVVCIGLIGLWSIDAHAWPASSSGWGATQNTVTIWSGWRGISNVDLKPTVVRVTLDSIVVAAQCNNNGGNDGGLGNPFMIPASVSGAQSSPQQAVKNGKWESNITFDEILDFGLVLDSSYCINPNWTNVGFVTKSFRVFIQAFEDVDTRCQATELNTNNCMYPMEEVVHIEGNCNLGDAPIGVGSAYTCSTAFQWEYTKRSTLCSDVLGCIYP